MDREGADTLCRGVVGREALEEAVGGVAIRGDTGTVLFWSQARGEEYLEGAVAAMLHS
jgi:hypothetical protein